MMFFPHSLSLSVSLSLSFGRFFTLKHIYLHTIFLLSFTHTLSLRHQMICGQKHALPLSLFLSCSVLSLYLWPYWAGGRASCVCVAPTAHTSTISSHHLPPPSSLIRRSMQRPVLLLAAMVLLLLLPDFLLQLPTAAAALEKEKKISSPSLSRSCSSLLCC